MNAYLLQEFDGVPEYGGRYSCTDPTKRYIYMELRLIKQDEYYRALSSEKIGEMNKEFNLTRCRASGATANDPLWVLASGYRKIQGVFLGKLGWHILLPLNGAMLLKNDLYDVPR